MTTNGDSDVQDLEVAAPQAAAAPASREPISRHELGEVLELALKAGQIMLDNGASTARVEETVERLAMSLGADSCDVYVTPTGIFSTITAGTEHRTRIQRIARYSVDLNRVAQVVELSRQAAAGLVDRTGVRTALAAIAVQKRVFGPILTSLGVGLACASSAMLFGGDVWEFGIAFVASILAFWARSGMQHWTTSRPLVVAITAAIGASLALSFSELLATQHPAQAVTGAVLFLVPGLLMISSITDLFRGDTISGVARATSALLVLVAIAGGVWAVLLITEARIDFQPQALDILWLAPILAFCSAGGFGVMFDIPWRGLFAAAAIGAVAYLVDRFSRAAGIPAGASAFLAGAAISLLAEILSRWLKLPTSIFTIPGFLPLVPGSAAFRTLLFFVEDNYADGTPSLVRTIVITVALGAGIGAISALFRLGRKFGA